MHTKATWSFFCLTVYITQYPQFLHSSVRYRLRSTGSADYILRRTRTIFGERGFSYCGPATWNALPSDLHDITDTGTFRKRLKSVLYDRAYHWLLLALLDVSYSGALQISRWLIDWSIDWLIDWGVLSMMMNVAVMTSAMTFRATHSYRPWSSAVSRAIVKLPDFCSVRVVDGNSRPSLCTETHHNTHPGRPSSVAEWTISFIVQVHL